MRMFLGLLMTMCIPGAVYAGACHDQFVIAEEFKELGLDYNASYKEADERFRRKLQDGEFANMAETCWALAKVSEYASGGEVAFRLSEDHFIHASNVCSGENRSIARENAQKSASNREIFLNRFNSIRRWGDKECR